MYLNLYKSILSHPANNPFPPSSRQLSSFPHSNTASSESKGTVTVCVHHGPEEFAVEAIKVGHPTRMHSFFPDEISRVVLRCLNQSAKILAMERIEEIKRWISLAQDLDEEERTLKESLSDRRKDVLKDKKFMLFTRLLADAGHEDISFVDQLADGFDLTGMLPESNVFNRKLRPASMSCEELRRVSDLGREGILRNLDTPLWRPTEEEVSPDR